MQAEWSPEIGVVLVDHGSKLDAANVMLDEIARLFAEAAGGAIVEPAHMELAEPTIAQAFARCVARGARTIVIQPYFLAPGRHSTRDIPRMAAEAAAAHEGVTVRVAAPLGVDVRLCAVLLDRVREGLEGDNDAHE